jgi:integrase
VATALKVVEPKTKSRRSIHMPGIVVTALKAQRARQREERMKAGAAWEHCGLIPVTEIRAALDARIFRAAEGRRAAGGRFHDLRHTAATLLLAQGLDPRTIMGTPGHSQISLTRNTCSHVLQALQAEAAAKLDAVLTR